MADVDIFKSIKTFQFNNRSWCHFGKKKEDEKKKQTNEDFSFFILEQSTF